MYVRQTHFVFPFIQLCQKEYLLESILVDSKSLLESSILLNLRDSFCKYILVESTR